jgi:hypothetical protein
VENFFRSGQIGDIGSLAEGDEEDEALHRSVLGLGLIYVKVEVRVKLSGSTSKCSGEGLKKNLIQSFQL